MRTITKEYTVYDFNDVINNPVLKERVLEKHYDINVNYDWWDWIIEEWNEKLENLGFENPNIEFSGFWSQGDGANFKCDSINIDKILNELKTLSKEEKNIIKWLNEYDHIGGVTIERNGCRYSHKHASNIVFYNYLDKNKQPLLHKLVNKFIDELEKIRVELCDNIYDELERAYTDLTSEELILDTLQCNEYEFLENGEIA